MDAQIAISKDLQGAKIKESLMRMSRIAHTLDKIPGMIDGGEEVMGYSLIGKSYVDLNNEISEIRYVLDELVIED